MEEASKANTSSQPFSLGGPSCFLVDWVQVLENLSENLDTAILFGLSLRQDWVAFTICSVLMIVVVILIVRGIHIFNSNNNY